MKSTQNNLAIIAMSASPEPMAPGIRQSPEIAKLVDISRCIGCKGCEVACKEWNELKVEVTHNFGSYQSHVDLSPDTWLLMRFNEEEVNGNLHWFITKDAARDIDQPLKVNGKTAYTIGIPVHWGFVGITQGAMANTLTPFVGDVNTRCPEFKAFLVDIEKA